VIGDGAKGFSKAVKRLFPGTRFQRCWVHKMRNVIQKVSKRDCEEVLENLRLIYNANSNEDAKKYLKILLRIIKWNILKQFNHC